MQLLKALIDQDKHGEPVLPPPLRELYGGDLQFPAASGTPYIIANFASTLDGVISFRSPGRSGGSAISGSNAADRFIMGLLRASADAVIVGAHTLQDVGRDSLWIAEYSYPSAKALFDEYRMNTLEKGPFPILVIVSGSGRLDLSRAAFRTPSIPTVVISTAAGRDLLARAGTRQLSNVEIVAVEADNGRIDATAIAQLLYAHSEFDYCCTKGDRCSLASSLQPARSGSSS